MDQKPIDLTISDYALLNHPLYNKGTAFTEEERDAFLLHGLLPPQITNLELQRQRAYNAFTQRGTPIEKYISLRSLQDTNETLFYSTLVHHIEELMPYVYTPVVGEGCIQFSRIFRRPRGLFISYPHREKMDQMLANARLDHTEIIVVSDGERILGLGDQGAGGMGIPIGKLCLYSACAGIHPRSTLPILLDVGTDNQELLDDPLYVGWRHKRVRGKEYEDFIEAFIQAVKKRFPKVLLQWEDFAQQNAGPLLNKYRDQLCTFNDDIQGTASVAVGTLLAAIEVTKTPISKQKIVVVGAGSAGCGISRLIKQAMINEGADESTAHDAFYLVDRNGLLTEDMELLEFQKEFGRKRSEVDTWTVKDPKNINLKEVIAGAKPTLMIGVCGKAGVFTEEVVKEMAQHVERPIIFPLSNPTKNAEATPEDLLKWTEGKVVMGTGSPFDPVQKEGKSFRVDQTNNSYIFPGMGLGIVAVEASRVSESMFMEAAKALAALSPAKNDPEGNLLPPLKEIREISRSIAIAVAKEAVSLGYTEKMDEQTIIEKVDQKMWEPGYVPYVKK